MDDTNTTDEASTNNEPNTAIKHTPSKDHLADLRSVWDETESRLESLWNNGQPVVLKAAPGTGKTTSVFRVAWASDDKLTYLAGRHDLYEEAKEKALDAGYDPDEVVILPTPHQDCPVFQGDHGEAKRKEWESLYDLGVGADELHDLLAAPCQPGCDYMSERVDDPDDYEVIIGHYRHGNRTEIIQDRVVVVDEFPESAFITEFTGTDMITSAVDGFLAEADWLPFNNYGDLVANTDLDTSLKVYDDLVEHGLVARDLDLTSRDEDDRYHRRAPLLVFAVMNGLDLSHGWTVLDTGFFFEGYPRWQRREYNIPPRTIIARRKGSSLEEEELYILDPCDLSSAKQVIGLDGTARKVMWDTVFAHDFEIEELISEAEMPTYVKDIQGMTLVSAGDGVKPYSSGEHVSVDTDAAFTLWTSIEYDDPVLITPKKAGEILQSEDPDTFEDDIKPVQAGDYDFMTYGMVRSNNDAAGEDAIVVCGSQHPGDDVIESWGALMYDRVERESGTKGQYLRYEPSRIGQQILKHFREDRVAQAIMRGRKASSSDSGAFVLVNTTATPRWFQSDRPPLTVANDSPLSSPQRRDIVRYLRDNGQTTTPELEDQFGINRQTARDCLEALIEKEWVQSTDRPGPYPTVYEWIL